MSSNSRNLGSDKKPPPDQEPRDEQPQRESGAAKRPSPGRYSMATDAQNESAAVRIDSTRMPAVRADAPLPPRRPSPSQPDDSPRPPPSVPRAGPPAPRPPLTAAGQAGAIPRGAPDSIRRATIPSSGAAAPPSALLPVNARPAPLPSALGKKRPPSVPPPSAASTQRGSTPDAGVAKPGSLRPPPPPRRLSSPPKAPPPVGARNSTPPPSLELELDEGSIAFAFDALLSEGTVNVPGNQQTDLAPVRELFAELAANHMRHVRDFMIDVKWGEAPRDWIEICVPAVTSLARAARRLDLEELGVSLDRFKEQLEVARNDSTAGRAISATMKEVLLDTYGQLVATLPQAFALDRDKSQREAVIVQSLLLSIPDVRKVTIDKLHSAGLTSLQTLFDAKADEVAQVAGVPEALAQRIVERFQAYRGELANASPQDARAAERERLATLTLQLKEQHDGYEEASKGWTGDAKAKKRDLFRAREETWLAISLLLARFGEVDRLNGIEKVPFAQRIAQLSEYLEEAREKYRLEV